MATVFVPTIVLVEQKDVLMNQLQEIQHVVLQLLHRIILAVLQLVGNLF
jgi:hypothetical protein